jgi:chorismate mutase
MNEETPGGVNPLVAKVVTAADAVRSQIRTLDEEIKGLHEQRQTITAHPVSKADFMEYVREDIRRRSKVYPMMIKKKWGDKQPFNNFDKLERTNGGHGEGLQGFPYLNWDLENMEFKLEPAAFYWYFSEVIQERFELAIQDFDWPAESMPVAERRQRIEAIDAQISDLISRRDGLKGQLKIALGA